MSSADLLAMHDGLAHRGPDGAGFLLVDRTLAARRFSDRNDLLAGRISETRLGMAFRRLRILDLSDRADAPLVRGNLWIALNGEIYNFRALRDELRGYGASFQTESDTEVALAAYERWGTEAFSRFDGMWAILIADLQKGILVGSRDRLGIKPLFYAVEPGRILFASEPIVVARALAAGPRVQPQRFVEFLHGFPPQSSSLSFFEGVHPVPAATHFEIDLRNPCPPDFQTFWDLAPMVVERGGNEDAPAERLEALLRDSVAHHMVADVAVGALLSGGIDSGVVARLMVDARSRNGGRPVLAFTLAHPDTTFDESKEAAAVVGMGGLHGITDALSPARGWELADDVIAAQGEPLLGFDLIGHYRMFQLARESGVTVVLEGQGADEIFGGYPFYESIHIGDKIRRLRLIDALQDIRAASRRTKRSLARTAAGFLRSSIRNSRTPPRYTWLTTTAPDFSTEPAPARAFENLLTDVLLRQTRETNLPSILLHQDRNSMAHGVETRVPFLDHRVVEFAFQLPVDQKIYRGERKRALLNVARRLLPPAVTERPTKRAIISTNDWIDLHGYRAPLLETISSRTLRDCSFIDPLKARQFVEGYFAGSHGDSLAVWRLFTAARWLEMLTR